MTDLIAVIPARWRSSRFPGKPLADLKGKPVIQWVFERVASVLGPESVVVATDDEEIGRVCHEIGARFLMTSPNCLTGTDRVAEVAHLSSALWYLNIQGDEPFVDPSAIIAMQDAISGNPDSVALNAIATIETDSDFRSLTVPKVVVDVEGRILYLSRSPIPVSKSGGFESAFRQVGLYAYSRKALEYFGVGRQKTPLEEVEDIEILRLIENGVSVNSVFVSSPGPAIDTPEDLDRARRLVETWQK